MLWSIFVPFVGPSDTRASAARMPARRTKAACSPCGPSVLPACALALIVRHPKRLVQTYCHVVAVSFLEDLP